MAKSPNSSPSFFGLDFQRNAAIVLMIKNIENARQVKVEGQKEDIEITLNNGKKIYSQVKSVYKNDDYSNVIENLKKSLKTLNNAAKESNVHSLIYITNTPNPFNNIKTMNLFTGGYTNIKYDKLDSICKNAIDNMCLKANITFDMKKLSICVIQFQKDINNRYKTIKETINDFLFKLNLGDRGFGQVLLELWQNEFFKNATHQNINISKKQMIWPIIVLSCEICRDDARIINLDNAEFEEIKRNYKAIICNNTERFAFITKVITSFQKYKEDVKNINPDVLFIDNEWNKFVNEINMPSASPDIIEKVIKLTLANVLKCRYTISDISRDLNL